MLVKICNFIIFQSCDLNELSSLWIQTSNIMNTSVDHCRFPTFYYFSLSSNLPFLALLCPRKILLLSKSNNFLSLTLSNN